MQIIVAGLPFSFIYPTYDENTDLFVQAAIYDVSTGSPVFLARVDMDDTQNGVYSGTYTGETGVSYLVIMAVYTDGGFSTVDSNRSPSAECYQVLSQNIDLLLFNYGAYNLSQDLFIKAKVYDTSTGTPSLVGSVTMTHVLNGVYFGSYSAASLGHSYSVAKFVYTNGTYTLLDEEWAPGSDVFQSSSFGGFNSIESSAILIGQSLNAILEATDA